MCVYLLKKHEQKEHHWRDANIRKKYLTFAPPVTLKYILLWLSHMSSRVPQMFETRSTWVISCGMYLKLTMLTKLNIQANLIYLIWCFATKGLVINCKFKDYLTWGSPWSSGDHTGLATRRSAV